MLIVGIILGSIGLAFFIAALIVNERANKILRRNNITIPPYRNSILNKKNMAKKNTPNPPPWTFPPKLETPVVETPVVETPVVETPVVESTGGGEPLPPMNQ